MTTTLRKLAARRRRAATPDLPPLSAACDSCEGNGQHYNDEIQEWEKEVEAAEREYVKEYPNAVGSFYSSWIYEELAKRQPPEFAMCGDCDGTGVILTPAGQQVHDLIYRNSDFDEQVRSIMRRAAR